MDELKPCPFCGGEAKLFDYEAEHDIYHPDTLGFLDTEYYDLWFCICEECGITTPDKRTEAEAVEAWNTRAERTCRNDNNNDPSRFTCSVCDWEDWDKYTADSDYNYCPGCGAKVVEQWPCR